MKLTFFALIFISSTSFAAPNNQCAMLLTKFISLSQDAYNSWVIAQNSSADFKFELFEIKPTNNKQPDRYILIATEPYERVYKNEKPPEILLAELEKAFTQVIIQNQNKEFDSKILQNPKNQLTAWGLFLLPLVSYTTTYFTLGIDSPLFWFLNTFIHGATYFAWPKMSDWIYKKYPEAVAKGGPLAISARNKEALNLFNSTEQAFTHTSQLPAAIIVIVATPQTADAYKKLVLAKYDIFNLTLSSFIRYPNVRSTSRRTP